MNKIDRFPHHLKVVDFLLLTFYQKRLTMEVYKSKYWNILFESENKMLIPTWNEASADLTNDLYKSEMEIYTQMVEKYHPNKALINCMKFYFAIGTDIQEWTNTMLFPRILAVGVTRVAIVMPADIITQMSLEQVMGEALGVKFVTNYFDNETAAREWLLKV